MKIFITYAHADAEWLEKISTHLKPLEKTKTVGIFSDKQLRTGDLWEREIIESLDTAEAAILLLSPSFFASDFIMDVELPKIFEKVSNGRLVVFPICLRPCSSISLGELSKYQFANPPSNALSEMSDAEVDRCLSDLVDEIWNASKVQNLGKSESERVREELEHSGKTIIENKDIRISSFEGMSQSFVIEDYAFVNCNIFGPGILYLDRDVQFVNSIFSMEQGSVDAMIFVCSGDKIVGPIIVRNCVFLRSRLSGVGFAAHQYFADELRKNMMMNIRK